MASAARSRAVCFLEVWLSWGWFQGAWTDSQGRQRSFSGFLQALEVCTVSRDMAFGLSYCTWSSGPSHNSNRGTTPPAEHVSCTTRAAVI